MKTVKWTLCFTMICAATFISQMSAFGADTDALVVTETGNVGIGLDDPQYQLDVKGNIHAGGLLLGTYPRHSDYMVFGSSSFDQTQIGNYALLQHNITGRTFLNSPSDIRFRIKNVDKMVLSGSGKVGIGTTSPTKTLVVNVNSDLDGAEFHSSSGWIHLAPGTMTNGSWNSLSAAGDTGIIFSGGQKNTGNLVIAPWATGAKGIKITAAGNVGIGIANPQDKLDVNGYVRANGSRLTSDIRWKENIEPLNNALDLVSQMRGVRYDWISSSRGEGRQIGVIAQEVEEVFPEVVHTDNQGYKSVEYSKLVAPLIESIKALKAENDSLKAALEMVERRLDQLER